MSNSIGQARFSDGQIFFFRFNGTSDYALPSLYPTPKFALAQNVVKNTLCDCENEDVELATDYGGGMHWEGKACKKCAEISIGLHPLEYGFCNDSLPWWWKIEPT
jgi:hypothetical protein